MRENASEAYKKLEKQLDELKNTNSIISNDNELMKKYLLNL